MQLRSSQEYGNLLRFPMAEPLSLTFFRNGPNLRPPNLTEINPIH